MVKLLSGGNPQIPKGEGDAPVLAYISAMPGWQRQVGKRLDAIIGDEVPGVRKAVKWNSAFYGAPHQELVPELSRFHPIREVTFFRGTSLDPMPAGKSKHPEVRYLDVREGGSTKHSLPTGSAKPAHCGEKM